MDKNHAWQSERLFFAGDDYFDGLEHDIASATTSIDYEVYLVEDDALSRRICAALAAAIARGVQVRFMVDGVGAGTWVAARAADVLKERINLRVFHPLPWMLFSSVVKSPPRYSHLFRLIQRVNRRNHRKVCIIDQRVAWIGSLNLTGKHCASISGKDAWRDTGARVEGPEVVELLRAFNYTWRRAWRFVNNVMHIPYLLRGRKEEGLSGLVRLNNKTSRRRRNFRDLLKRIVEAKQRVWITTAYFVPRGRLLRALSAAAREKKDVRILVPSKSDIVWMPWVTAAFYVGLLKSGVRIFEFQPRNLHAKTVLIDDWLTVGSTNLNNRSLLHDLEADVVLSSRASLDAAERAFEGDIAQSKEVTHRDWKARPWWQQLMARLALRLKKWI